MSQEQCRHLIELLELAREHVSAQEPAHEQPAAP
jgi:hypothetical protein